MILSALRRIRNRALSPSQLRCQHSLRYDCHRQSWIFEIRCAAHHPRQRGPKGAAQKPAPSEGAKRGGYSKTPSSERAKAFFDRLTPLRKGRRFSAGSHCSPSGKKNPLTFFSLFSYFFLTWGFPICRDGTGSRFPVTGSRGWLLLGSLEFCLVLLYSLLLGIQNIQSDEYSYKYSEVKDLYIKNRLFALKKIRCSLGVHAAEK